MVFIKSKKKLHRVIEDHIVMKIYIHTTDDYHLIHFSYQPYNLYNSVGQPLLERQAAELVPVQLIWRDKISWKKDPIFQRLVQFETPVYGRDLHKTDPKLNWGQQFNLHQLCRISNTSGCSFITGHEHFCLSNSLLISVMVLKAVSRSRICHNLCSGL